MPGELRLVLVTMVLTVWIGLGGACGDGSSSGESGAAGIGGTGSVPTASGGSGGAYRCSGPVTESQVVQAFCADAPVGASELAIVDADCGATRWTSGEYLDPVFEVAGGSVFLPDGGQPDGGPPDGGQVDAGLGQIGSISVHDGFGDLIQLANPTGIPGGSQPVVSRGNGTSLFVGVNFGVAHSSAMRTCYAQSGDVDVTPPTTVTGTGAAVSFTAHCRQNTADAGTSFNLVGCFRL